MLIASSDGVGSVDVSPKGDPPGFVSVLDEQVSAVAGSDDLLLAQTMVKHGALAVTVDQMQEIIVDDEEKRLY